MMNLTVAIPNYGWPVLASRYIHIYQFPGDTWKIPGKERMFFTGKGDILQTIVQVCLCYWYRIILSLSPFVVKVCATRVGVFSFLVWRVVLLVWQNDWINGTTVGHAALVCLNGISQRCQSATHFFIFSGVSLACFCNDKITQSWRSHTGYQCYGSHYKHCHSFPYL